MPGDLYEQDVLAWSEQQAGLLRRMAAGGAVNDAPDWPTIIEEVESVGNEQLHDVSSRLRASLAFRCQGERLGDHDRRACA